MRVDIAVIGGGMGGVAAALAACDAGLRVVLTEETDWLGGQMTSQGTSAFDEHNHIERFGGTRSYYALREGIRKHYIEAYGAPTHLPKTIHGENVPLNPGNGWVSRLCFEPRVGVQVINAMLQPHIDSGLLTVLYHCYPAAAEMNGSKVVSVTVKDAEGTQYTIEAAYFLDATELGDLLPLTNTAYVVGAEAQSDTGEPDAPPEARPEEVQSFTACFAVEYRPGENHVISKPEGYDTFNSHDLYTLVLTDKQGNPLYFDMFRKSAQGNLPFWTYRRLYSGDLLGGNDITLINWGSNDYYFNSIVDVSREERARFVDEGKRQSLGFLYWLQTECPRDDGGRGYPEFMLRPDVMDTADGLGKYPYVREGRRLVAKERLVQRHIAAETNPGPTAAPMRKPIGLGWYAMDLHPCVGNPKVSMFSPTKPFQVPLGLLLPRDTENLIAACKNIGTTHLTNGAYRLHPTEWNIGESAATLAAYCIQTGTTPEAVYIDETPVTGFEERLLERGIPLTWTLDTPPDNPNFVTAQIQALHEESS